MSHRLGTCTSCKAQYKVPASFQADRAKCKSCGGVVQIAPLGGAAPAAAKPATAKPAAPKPAAAAPAANPVPARPVPARPVVAAPKPAAEEKDSVRAAAAAAAERVRSAGSKEPAGPVAAESKSKEGAGSSRSGGKGSAREKSKGAGRSGRRGSRSQPSKAPMLAAVVVLLVAGGGGAAWFLMRGGDEGPKAAESAVDSASAPAASQTSAPVEEQAAAVESAPAATDPAAEIEAPVVSEAAPVETPAAKSSDEDIDLSAFPDESKLPGTSDEDWASIREWTATFLDANAGAAGNRARGKLAERGREAFPAMLNAMKRLDFSTDDGFRAGDLAQRFLMDVCNGQNFDWKYGTEPADVIFNKKVVRSWIKAWEQGRDVPKGWAKLTKTTEEEALALFAVTGPFDAAAAAPAGGDASSSIDDL